VICSPEVTKHFHAFSFIENVIKELHDTEETYIQNLKNGIESYMDRKDHYSDVACQKFLIFGNIKNIFDFHSKELFPELKFSGFYDIEKTAEIFNYFLSKETGGFYYHVTLAMNQKQSDGFCESYNEYWKVIKLLLCSFETLKLDL